MFTYICIHKLEKSTKSHDQLYLEGEVKGS